MRWILMAATIAIASPTYAGFLAGDCTQQSGLAIEDPEKAFCECTKVEEPIEKLTCFDDAKEAGFTHFRRGCKDPFIGFEKCYADSEIMKVAANCNSRKSLERLSCYENQPFVRNYAYWYFLRRAREMTKDRDAKRALEVAISEAEK